MTRAPCSAGKQASARSAAAAAPAGRHANRSRAPRASGASRAGGAGCARAVCSARLPLINPHVRRGRWVHAPCLNRTVHRVSAHVATETGATGRVVVAVDGAGGERDRIWRRSRNGARTDRRGFNARPRAHAANHRLKLVSQMGRPRSIQPLNHKSFQAGIGGEHD
jgi:hypothetical protein